MLKLLVKETEDDITRENMKRIQKEITANQIILNGQWRFVELTFTTAVTNFKYPHKLDFVPKDIIQTNATGPGALTIAWNYDQFDRTNLDITVYDACSVRAFVGRYEESGGSL